jgi:hypothetical protein
MNQAVVYYVKAGTATNENRVQQIILNQLLYILYSLITISSDWY